ncbi:MAG: RidA family protein [Deinococcales bacterium]|nr:RidA family protein [Deinococcales bacterium]|tara:strand:+ start:2069 stop:2452 length:384 start_codon:yes stop_codon:yes gene_type:complete
MARKTYLESSTNPYSLAVRAGDTLYLSGHVPIDPATGDISGNNVTDQARQTFDNLVATLQAVNASLDDVVKVGVFLTDVKKDFEAMNAVYRDYFPVNPPARTTVGISALALSGLLIEIEMTAYVPEK